ncbi:MAG: acyltransferase [Pseudomonadota bacterium]
MKVDKTFVQERNNSIDIFRFLAIFLVTTVHVFEDYLVSINRVPPLKSFYEYGAFFNYFNFFALFSKGHSGVRIFFVISGYCLAATSFKKVNVLPFKQFYLQFFVNRYLRIAIPYIVALIVYYLFHRINSKEFLISLFFLQNIIVDGNNYGGISHFWSLCTEIYFYLYFPLIFKFITIKGERFYLLNSVIVLVALKTILYLYPNTWMIFRSCELFIFGILLFFYKNKLYDLLFQKPSARVLKPVFFILLLLVVFYNTGTDYLDHLFVMFIDICIPIIIGSVMAVMIVREEQQAMSFVDYNSGVVIKIIIFLGRSSYSIYLYNLSTFFCNIHSDHNVFVQYAFILFLGISMYFLIEKPSLTIRKYIMQRLSLQRSQQIV